MRYDKEQIGQWISEWEQSGQSIKKFCEEKPFDKSSFYNWRKRVTVQSEIKQNSQFLPLQMSPTFIPHISIHYPNGVRVDVHMILSSVEIRTLAGC